MIEIDPSRTRAEVRLSPTMVEYFKLLDREREAQPELAGKPIMGQRSLELMKQAAETVGDLEFAKYITELL